MTKIFNIMGVIGVLCGTIFLNLNYGMAILFFLYGNVNLGLFFLKRKNTPQVILNVVLIVVNIYNLMVALAL